MTAITAEGARRAPLIRQLGVDSAYVIVGFPIAIVAFVVVITLFSVGLGLAITLLGLPILVGALYAARALAWTERARVPAVLREPYVAGQYRSAPADAGRWRRLLTPFTDPQAWLDLAYAVIRFPFAVATFAITVTWWALALGGLTYPAYGWSIPYGTDNQDLPELLGFRSTPTVRALWYVGIGVVAALMLPLVVRLCALIDAHIARAMLTILPRMRAEMAGLTDRAARAQGRTAAAVSAEATALRKLERDIHDGPQQRLVRLAVDLGRAQQQLDTDPSSARATLDEAMTQARETLDELRVLSRGIAPPILTDRGLAAAVAALAARSTVPVQLDIPELGRLEPFAEQTIYFTIAEALTNVAKHSAAELCTVAVHLNPGTGVEVTISDNGRGGAHLAKGHGLSGLADRLHSAGGELWISSPEGGPTKLRAEVPCPTG